VARESRPAGAGVADGVCWSRTSARAGVAGCARWSRNRRLLGGEAVLEKPAYRRQGRRGMGGNC